MSSTSIDLTLPASSTPEFDFLRDAPQRVSPFAVYIHIDLSSDETTDLIRACNSQTDHNPVELSPQYSLIAKPLRAAFDIHVKEVINGTKFDPFFFVAVVDKDWQNSGVMLVNLNSTFSDLDVDVMKVPTTDTALLLVNMHIDNVPWGTCKKEYVNDDGSKARICPDQSGNDVEESNEKGLDEENEDRYSDGAAVEVPFLGYWIGFYAVKEVDNEKLMRDLDHHPSRQSLSELIPRPEGQVPRGENAAVEEASKLHPGRCLDNKKLHRTLFLVADSTSYKEEGILLVRLDWDGMIKGTTRQELSTWGGVAPKRTKRIPVSSQPTILIFDSFACGHRPWKHTHITFLAYGGLRVDDIDVVEALDRDFYRRKAGEERFVHGHNEPDKETSTTQSMWGFEAEHPWRGTIRRHPLQVYRERFRETLNRQWFVYRDERLFSEDDIVTLAKMDWDGAVEGKSLEELWAMEGMEGKVTVLQCRARDAYERLVQLVGQEQDSKASE